MKKSILKKIISKVIKEMFDTFEDPDSPTDEPTQEIPSAEQKRVEYLKELIPLANLNEKEKIVLNLRLEGYTFEEIAAMYKVSTPRIQQIQNRVARKIRIAAQSDISIKNRASKV